MEKIKEKKRVKEESQEEKGDKKRIKLEPVEPIETEEPVQRMVTEETLLEMNVTNNEERMDSWWLTNMSQRGFI